MNIVFKIINCFFLSIIGVSSFTVDDHYREINQYLAHHDCHHLTVSCERGLTEVTIIERHEIPCIIGEPHVIHNTDSVVFTQKDDRYFPLIQSKPSTITLIQYAARETMPYFVVKKHMINKESILTLAPNRFFYSIACDANVTLRIQLLPHVSSDGGACAHIDVSPLVMHQPMTLWQSIANPCDFCHQALSYITGDPTMLFFKNNILHYENIPQSDFYTAVQQRYDQNRLMIMDDTLRIPQIVHLIWLTSVTKPRRPKGLEHLHYNQRIVRPRDGWQYIYWTNVPSVVSSAVPHNVEVRDITTLKSAMGCVDAFDHAMAYGNYGKASDILRYELLSLMGGIYVDVDFHFTLSPLALHYCVDFYSGMEGIGACAPCNAMLASAKNHPIMTRCLTEIQKLSRDLLMNKAHFSFHSLKNTPLETLAVTGPFQLGVCFFKNSTLKDILFPPYTFFWHEQRDGSTHDFKTRNVGCHDHFMSWF